MISVQHPAPSQPPSALPTAAEIIAHDLERLIDDERAIQHIVGLCLTIHSRGMLSTTQEAGAIYLLRMYRELEIVRAAKRHLQHQARVEGLTICDICGTADGVTAAYDSEIGCYRHLCVPCSRVELG